MNRAQRRKLQKDQKRVAKGTTNVVALAEHSTRQPDFSDVPLATMCQSIQLLINELYQRGFPVYDFDNKQKFVQQIQIIQGKVYFLAAEEDFNHEKV